MVMKQVFLVNEDLRMGKGKIAVQVAHGEVKYMVYIFDVVLDNEEYTDHERRYDLWINEDDMLMKKVVLKVNDTQMSSFDAKLSIMKIWHDVVIDRGLTQVPENPMTCIVVEPLDEIDCDKIFGHLKLL